MNLVHSKNIRIFKRECYLDTKLRIPIIYEKKKRFNKYIHRMESDDKISINIFVVNMKQC